MLESLGTHADKSYCYILENDLELLPYLMPRSDMVSRRGNWSETSLSSGDTFFCSAQVLSKGFCNLPSQVVAD